MVREAAANLLEVVQDESVSVCQPPIGVDPFGQHDHVARLLFTVDDDATENGSPRASASSHLRLESVRRSVHGPVQPDDRGAAERRRPGAAGRRITGWSSTGPSGSRTSVRNGNWWELL